MSQNGPINNSKTSTVQSSGIKRYQDDNYNLQYHDASFVSAGGYDPSQGTWMSVKGTMTFVPWTQIQQYVTYNAYGTYRYGNHTYVPSYEESVLLSKTSRTTKTPSISSPTGESMFNGFCSQLNSSTGMHRLQEMCHSLPKEQCATTSCCILRGDDSCVAGNMYGPYQYHGSTSMYQRDATVNMNRDYYYYQGKCYGNCIR
jgi:hypothetical protein